MPSKMPNNNFANRPLRTPEHRFDDLLDYNFQAHYHQIADDLRMHYLDESLDENQSESQDESSSAQPADKQVILMLHGEPSWSYLYRHMIPVCVAQGHRVIAPDLIGFGKSDKPSKVKEYSFQTHLDWLQSLIDHLDLNDITLVCQDWGGLLGLRLVAANPERFARIVVGNSMLPTGEMKTPLVFNIWRTFAKYTPWFPVAKILQLGTRRTLNERELSAYDAPFPNKKYKAGVKAFPLLVPMDFDDPENINNRQAWKVLENWQKPFLTSFSSGDPIMRGGDRVFQKRVPGTQGQKHTTLRGGHFLQEDSGPEFGQVINQFISDNPL